jgi:hypothetical protein
MSAQRIRAGLSYVAALAKRLLVCIIILLTLQALLRQTSKKHSAALLDAITFKNVT